MEYVEGQDLASTISKHGVVPVATAVDYILQAARGLDYAHGRASLTATSSPPTAALPSPDPGQGVGSKILDMGLARMDQDTAGAADEGLTTAAR